MIKYDNDDKRLKGGHKIIGLTIWTIGWMGRYVLLAKKGKINERWWMKCGFMKLLMGRREEQWEQKG